VGEEELVALLLLVAAVAEADRRPGETAGDSAAQIAVKIDGQVGPLRAQPAGEFLHCGHETEPAQGRAEHDVPLLARQRNDGVQIFVAPEELAPVFVEEPDDTSAG